jgi:hypothetical protein
LGLTSFYRRVLPGLVDSCRRNIRGGLNFNLIWGKAPLADNFAAPVEKDPLVDVNVEVQRQSTTRQGAAGTSNALDSQCRFTTDRLWRKAAVRTQTASRD